MAALAGVANRREPRIADSPPPWENAIADQRPAHLDGGCYDHPAAFGSDHD